MFAYDKQILNLNTVIPYNLILILTCEKLII
jgi:hypothetical protein